MSALTSLTGPGSGGGNLWVGERGILSPGTKLTAKQYEKQRPAIVCMDAGVVLYI